MSDEPYFEEPTNNGFYLRLVANPLVPGDVYLEIQGEGMTLRVGLAKERALRLATAAQRWYQPEGDS